MKDYCGRGGRRTSNVASWGGASRGRQSAIEDRAEAESYLHVAYMHSPLESRVAAQNRAPLKVNRILAGTMHHRLIWLRCKRNPIHAAASHQPSWRR
jgi:hypothetical protein